MRIAFVIGHHKKSKGALAKHFNLREWDFYNEVVKELGNVNVFHHDENISGYNTRIKNTAKKVNKVDFDLVIELHFNRVSDPRANGCETLYYFASKKGKQYALKFSEILTRETGIKSRNGGLKALSNKNDRGFASVYYTKAPTIMLEPFFGSNESDCKKIQSPKNLARIINVFLDTIKYNTL